MSKYYYVDASVLLAEDFYKVVAALTTQTPAPIFLLDGAVQNEIEESRRRGERERALTLENYYNLFSLLPGSMEVYTLGGFNLASLLPMAESLTVLTMRKPLRERFAALGNAVEFYCVEKGALAPLPTDFSENAPAFYLEEDHYLVPFDIGEIDYVFSPRFGYLKLDKSRPMAGGEGVCYPAYHGLFA